MDHYPAKLKFDLKFHHGIVIKYVLLILFLLTWTDCFEDKLPIVVNTWAFTDANAEGKFHNYPRTFKRKS